MHSCRSRCPLFAGERTFMRRSTGSRTSVVSELMNTKMSFITVVRVYSPIRSGFIVEEFDSGAEPPFEAVADMCRQPVLGKQKIGQRGLGKLRPPSRQPHSEDLSDGVPQNTPESLAPCYYGGRTTWAPYVEPPILGFPLTCFIPLFVIYLNHPLTQGIKHSLLWKLPFELSSAIRENQLELARPCLAPATLLIGV